MRRSVSLSVAAALLTVGALAACGSKNPPSTAIPTAFTTVGPDPSATPTPTPSATPDAEPTNNPASTIPNKMGYAWISDPSANHAVVNGYTYNQGGGPVNFVRNGVGKYEVRFGGLGSGGGVAHAQAYGNTSDYCSIDNWGNSGGDQVVRVNCFDLTGVLADTQFLVNFAVGSQGNARFGYLWADNAGSASYKPDAEYRYDAVDSGEISISRPDTGRYQIFIPTSGPLDKPWTFQVTAYSSTARCKLVSFSESNRRATVACRAPGGSYVDSQFSLSFASNSSALGRTDRKYGHFNQDSNNVENPATGAYRVLGGPNLGGAKGQVLAVATGTSNSYCHTGSWGASGSNMSMRVYCFNSAGAPTNSPFEVTVTW